MGQYFFLGTYLINLACFEKYYLVGNIQNSFLMRDYHNRTATTLVHTLENLDKAVKAPKVNSCLGLIKD